MSVPIDLEDYDWLSKLTAWKANNREAGWIVASGVGSGSRIQAEMHWEDAKGNRLSVVKHAMSIEEAVHLCFKEYERAAS